MNEMLPQVMIEFCLIGDSIDFDAVTATLGLSPTNTRKKESFKYEEFAKDEWIFSTGYMKSTNISSVFEKLIDVFIGKEDSICQLISEYDLDCVLIVVIKALEGTNPEMILTQKCIRYVHAINAEIHLDMYLGLGSIRQLSKSTKSDKMCSR